METETDIEIKKEIEKKKMWGLLSGHQFKTEVPDLYDGKRRQGLFKVTEDVQEVFVEGDFYKYKGETRSKGKIVAILKKDGSTERSLDFGDYFFGLGTEIRFDPSQKNLDRQSVKVAPEIPEEIRK